MLPERSDPVALLPVIGVFDSGVGGLGVVVEIQKLLPRHDILYLADRARAPYGRRPIAQVRAFSDQITRHLLDRGAELVVVACNTASAVSLNQLRAKYPGVAFVGMEPAIKPAAAASQTRTIAVLATAVTFQGELFSSLRDRYAEDITLVEQVCDGWVEQVESGVVSGPEVNGLVRRHLDPMLAAGADTLVLGCTHYPFLIDSIRAVVGDSIQIIDPAPAVARQVARLVGPGTGGKLTMGVTGVSTGVAELVSTLTGLSPPVTVVTLP